MLSKDAIGRRFGPYTGTVDANRLMTSMEDLLRRTIGESVDLEMVTGTPVEDSEAGALAFVGREIPENGEQVVGVVARSGERDVVVDQKLDAHLLFGGAAADE